MNIGVYIHIYFYILRILQGSTEKKSFTADKSTYRVIFIVAFKLMQMISFIMWKSQKMLLSLVFG